MSFFFTLGSVCLDTASRISKSKIEKTAAAVSVGIGLLSGSLSLHAEDEVGSGRGGNNLPFANVCAPTVEAIWITEDQHLHQFTVKVTLSSDGWYQFPGPIGIHSYGFKGKGRQYSDSFLPGLFDFNYKGGATLYSESQARIAGWSLYSTVWFDLPSTSSSDYSFEINLVNFVGQLVHFRGKHYYWWNHWVIIYLNLSDLDPRSGRLFVGVTPYRVHAYISPSDSPDYYVHVYLRTSPSREYEELDN